MIKFQSVCVALIVFAVIAACRTSSPSTRWYFVRFSPLCDEKTMGVVDWDLLEKYGTYTPFDTIKSTKGDSATISFDFMADCCLTFSGKAEVKNDTLVLEYGLDRVYTESCGCWCTYRLVYQLDITKRSWNQIKIIHNKESIFRKQG